MALSLFTRLKDFIVDPLGVNKVIGHMNASASMLQGDILHTNRRTEELTKLFHSFGERMEEYMLLKSVQEALDCSIPDMFWVKDKEGKYVIANCAIRNGLIFDDNPYGKDDRQLASAEIERVGAENHTFGSICGNSDDEVLKHEKPMKFNEDGLVRGKYLMLQVHKNVVRNKKGEVIATVGVGRDITYEITKLREILEITSCAITKEKIQELMNHYHFEDRT